MLSIRLSGRLEKSILKIVTSSKYESKFTNAYFLQVVNKRSLNTDTILFIWGLAKILPSSD